MNYSSRMHRPHYASPTYQAPSNWPHLPAYKCRTNRSVQKHHVPDTISTKPWCFCQPRVLYAERVHSIYKSATLLLLLFPPPQKKNPSPTPQSKENRSETNHKLERKPFYPFENQAAVDLLSPHTERKGLTAFARRLSLYSLSIVRFDLSFLLSPLIITYSLLLDLRCWGV